MLGSCTPSNHDAGGTRRWCNYELTASTSGSGAVPVDVSRLAPRPSMGGLSAILSRGSEAPGMRTYPPGAISDEFAGGRAELILAVLEAFMAHELAHGEWHAPVSTAAVLTTAALRL